jgi:hypothetical protein
MKSLSRVLSDFGDLTRPLNEVDVLAIIKTLELEGLEGTARYVKYQMPTPSEVEDWLVNTVFGD